MKVGVHVFKGRKGIDENIKKVKKEIKLDSIQLFTHGPRSYKKVNHDYKKIIKETKGIEVYVHSSYFTNPWNGKPMVMDHTVDQFRSSKKLKAKGVVLHIPKIEPAKVARTVKVLKDILVEKKLMSSQKIILEMKAMRPDPEKTYESPEKINRLIGCLKDEKLNNSEVVICVDTAHINAGGSIITTYEDATNYLKKIAYPNWIGLIHLNGNAFDYKKQARDKHALPFDKDDYIWTDVSYENSGCRAFIEFCQSNNIHFILEVKERHSIKQIKEFISLTQND